MCLQISSSPASLVQREEAAVRQSEGLFLTFNTLKLLEYQSLTTPQSLRDSSPYTEEPDLCSFFNVQLHRQTPICGGEDGRIYHIASAIYHFGIWR